MSTTATALVVLGGLAHAATYQVGPSRTYTQLSQVVDLAAPGDVIELDGGATYGPVTLTQSGSANARITVRGVGATRPIIAGGEHTIRFESANYWTFDFVEITGGTETCVLHRGAETIFTSSVIHDCDRHGILGTDDNSGSLLLEYVEVYATGSERADENLKHQVYVATDSTVWPDAVFRMQYCYVHDAVGGNSVKSRARRTELYYNWLEGAQYYEIELIGPDGEVPAAPPREDADVVGNVIVQTTAHLDEVFPIRVGSDLSGETDGRYRFVNNLIVAQPERASGPMRCAGAVESIELHNNAFVQVDGSAFWYGVRRTDCEVGENVFGSHNWFPEGTDEIPAGIVDSRFGRNPGFSDLGAFDFRLTQGSPLVNGGTSMTSTGGSFAFPDPLVLPEFYPPIRARMEPGGELQRTITQTVDIGPFEYGSDLPDPGGGDGGASPSLCGCRASGSARGSALATMWLLVLAVRIGRRPTRRRGRG